MIYVDAPIQQELIISLLENTTEAKFSFHEKIGMRLSFKVEGISSEEAVKIAKAVIKSDTIGASLYLQVSA